MNIKYFDIHSHLNFPQYNEDREEIIQKMKDNNVWTICVGTGEKTSKECIKLANRHKNIYATVGVHPSDGVEDFKELPLSEKVVMVGECGLDYFRNDDKQRQKKLFEKQIQFAKEKDMPLMLHLRTKDAYEDALDMLDGVRGNAHFFAGTLDIAKKFLEKGFSISFAGPITFTNEYDEIIKYVPKDMIMAETDAPFASPEPYRGRRNSPLYVKEVVKRIGEIKGESMAQQLVENAKRLIF